MFGDDDPRGPRPAFAWGGPQGPDDEGYWWRGWKGPHGPGFGPGFGFGPDFGFGPGMGNMMRHFARRFGFGPGPGMPPGGPRMFGRGDLKYALLDLLQERPKHGYEMIKEMEDRSGGFYTPSAGAIYPTLQLLEDRDWVTTQVVEGKKVYSITDAGREALRARREQAETFGGPRGGWGRHHHGHGGPFGREARPELGALRHESFEVARLLRAAVLASGGDPERLARLRSIVERTHKELDEYLGQSRPESGAGQAPAEGQQGSSQGPVEQV
jgi:DNA-binding PadR family transcriptional regulator